MRDCSSTAERAVKNELPADTSRNSRTQHARRPLRAEALTDTLRDKRITAAAIDVFDIEPLPAAHPLRSLPNTLGPVPREQPRSAPPLLENGTRRRRRQSGELCGPAMYVARFDNDDVIPAT
jgi:hypothetical protein